MITKLVIPNSVRDTIRRRVRRGAAALDATTPKWRKKVKVDLLEMSNGTFCVLGQVYGKYWKGMQKTLNVSSAEEAGRAEDRLSITHGFNLGWRDDEVTVKKLVKANTKPNARRDTIDRETDVCRLIAWDLLHAAWVKEVANA